MVVKWIKRLAYLLAILIFLIAGFILFLHTSTGKSLVRSKVEGFLRQKWHTAVSIGNIDYSLPNWIALEQVYIPDRHGDTLLYGGRLYVAIRLLKLLSGNIDVTGIHLDDISLNFRRSARDTDFNFKFIIDAFAPSPAGKQKKAGGSEMRLSIRSLSLNNVHISFQDQKQQLYFSTSLKAFSCLPAFIDLQNNIYRFKKIALLHVAVFYQKPHDRLSYILNVDSLQLKEPVLDLLGQRITVKNIQMAHSEVSLTAWRPPQQAAAKNSGSPTSTGSKWSFGVDTLSLWNNSFSYVNEARAAAKGLDFQHLHVRDFNLHAIENHFDPSGFHSGLKDCSLLINDRLNIRNVAAGISLTDSMLRLNDLTAAVNQSQLVTRGDAIWPLFPGGLDAYRPHLLIDKGVFCYGDLLLVLPDLKKQLPVSLTPHEKIVASGNISGTLRNFISDDLNIAVSRNLAQLQASVALRMEKGGPALSAALRSVQLKKQLLSSTLLRQLQKRKIALPDAIAVNGKLGVNGARLVTNLSLSSSFGQLHLDAMVHNFASPDHIRYKISLNAKGLETGKWIGLDSILGKITGLITIEGRSIKPQQLIALADLQLRAATIREVVYRNIDIKATWERSQFNMQSNIRDSNLIASLLLDGQLSPFMSVKGSIHVMKADLFGLGFTSDSSSYAGKIGLDFSYESHKINAYVRADQNYLSIHGKQMTADSIVLACHASDDSVLLDADAPFLNARFKSNYSFKTLPSVLASLTHSIYPVEDSAGFNGPEGVASNHTATLDAKVRDSAWFNTLMPGLKLSPPLTIRATYNAQQADSLFFLQLTAPGIGYQQWQAQGLQVSVRTADSGLQYSAFSAKVVNGAQMLTDAHVSGHLQKNRLLIRAEVKDSIGQPYYRAGLAVKKQSQETTIKLLDDLTLDHRKWTVSSDNWIRLSKDGAVIHHLALENTGRRINVSTQELPALSPIDIRVDSFDIGNIAGALRPGDNLGAKGILNAAISIQQPIGKVPVISGEVQATNIALLGTDIGDLQIKSRVLGDTLALQGRLSGANQLDCDGYIMLSDQRIGLHARLARLNSNTIQVFTKDFLSYYSGNIRGDLQLAGSLDSPKYQAAIYLDSVAFAVKGLNTRYRIDQQTLHVNDSGLRFQQFAVLDSAGHPLTIQGGVAIFNPLNQNLDANITTKSFVILNSIRQPKSSLYGMGVMDIAVALKGTLDEPVIEGDIYLQGKSNVHLLANPSGNSVRSRKEGIVFVDIDTLESVEQEIEHLPGTSKTEKRSNPPLKYDLNIKVDKEAAFNLIIDPSTNDELAWKGEGKMHAGTNENGNVDITGGYNLQSGYYKMNNLLLRGKFMLTKGSSISFNGDPKQTEADVTTEYLVEASPKGLVNYQEADNAAYSQRLLFAIVLLIKGPVTKPVLSFDIQLREGKAAINSNTKSDVEHALDRLRSDVTEMNKQVFSLLLTKRFADISGASTLESSNLNANNALKEGVSSFLSEAMNQVADQFIKGVDVDVNMKTYKTADDPISKTDLGVAMSKGLFEDRLVIRIEENIPMGNSNTSAAQGNGSQYIPDVTSTYKISKDGRLKLKAYQKNEYDAVVQGYFTEVGVTFSIEMSYDKFMELVQRRRKSTNERK